MATTQSAIATPATPVPPFAGTGTTVFSPLSTLLRRAPVTAAYDSSVANAVRTIVAEDVSSVVVIDPASGLPLGIFTLRDLARRVALAPGGLDQPVAAVMTAGLVTLPATAPAHQAATLMARRRLHHVVVVDRVGQLLGVVSQTDLINLSRLGTRQLANEIADASSTGALVVAQRDILRLIDRLLDMHTGADAITQLVVELNDLIASRVIELTLDRMELPHVRWCWIALGSEGRLEQTLATDQDNGLIFDSESDDPADCEALRQAFLPFAREVNRQLAECGFPLCQGRIMAGNPRWCLSLDEWTDRFERWIAQPQPEALLHAAIFFDLRAIYGEASLARRLHERLLARTAANPLFLRMMAENALRAQPPLGTFRDFRFDAGPGHPHTIDLKMYGARPFVDAARILALAHGVFETNTAERLRTLADQKHFRGDDVHAIVDAFWFVHSLRLRHQRDPGAAAGDAPNRIDPDQLNELDRQILKQSFRQARKLQEHLRAEYRL